MVHAQGNPPQFCPADPVATLSILQQQIDQVYSSLGSDAKNAAIDLKAITGDPGALSLKIANYEELLFQYETQAHFLYEQVRETNRCGFRSGTYQTWVSIEQATQLWTKTYLKVIKVTTKSFKTFYKFKVKWLDASPVGCCLCNGVPNPVITNCASAPGVTMSQCNIACLPFTSNGGQWFSQSRCDTGTGTCVPDL